MIAPPTPLQRLAQPRAARGTCADCRSWPCRCGHVDEDMAPFALRVERCACGGDAIVAGGRPSTVLAAVAAHNATPAHRAWRADDEAAWTAGEDASRP